MMWGRVYWDCQSAAKECASWKLIKWGLGSWKLGEDSVRENLTQNHKVYLRPQTTVLDKPLLPQLPLTWA